MEIDNQGLARIFAEMAELLRIRGGEPHRAAAFERSAKAIESLPEPAAKMLHGGRLQKTPGIGDGTVHRIKQILRTGSCDDLRRLRAALPPSIRDLLRLKGLGPATVRQLYEQAGVRSIDDLDQAIRSGLVRRRLPRLGVERLHAMLEAIAVQRARGGQIPLVEALRLVDDFVRELEAVPGVERVAAGGSVRRRRAMIGDLDLVIATREPKAAIEAFLASPRAAAVISRRTDGGSIYLSSMRQADLWVFPPDQWGAGLHAFTGNKEHNIQLRKLAGRKGLHISEHGIADRSSGQRLTSGRTEDEIYAAVGLPTIPVALRRGLGEIEAAEQGRLPTPIVEADLRGDLHMHTTWSDGSATPEAMAEAAGRLGLEYIAITDHSQSLGVANGLTPERLAEQRRRLRALEDRGVGPALLAGIEVDILADGALDLDASALRPLDWVVASVHSHLDQDRETMTARVVRALETGLVDCLGHPTGRRLGRRPASAIDLDRVFEVARRIGVCLEINGSPTRMDLADAHCRQARDLGVMLSLDTDAHAPSELERRAFGLAMARRGWVEKRHVINTRPVDEVLAWRRDRLRHFGIAVPAARPRPEREAASGATRTATTGDADQLLLEALGRRPLETTTRQRLERYLASGDDPSLEVALTTLDERNPIQQAFDLLTTADGGEEHRQ